MIVAWDEFLPEVFWITPEGRVIEVIGHLTAIRQDPESFGLSRPPRTKGDIDEEVIKGWLSRTT